MFFEASKFEFVSILEANLLLIKRELEQLQPTHFMPWPEKFLYNKNWEAFGLYAFGTKLNANCQLCPETTRLVETIPGMTTAGFSSLAVGTHITPHIGYSKAVLRCHLGLTIPDGCMLRVGNQTRSWQEGKCLIFDDTIEHEAWNFGDRTRIILLIDFKNPETISNNQFEANCSDKVSQSIQNFAGLSS